MGNAFFFICGLPDYVQEAFPVAYFLSMRSVVCSVERRGPHKRKNDEMVQKEVVVRSSRLVV